MKRLATRTVPDGPHDLEVWVVIQAVRDVMSGKEESEDAKAYLLSDNWVVRLNISEETVDKIRRMALNGSYHKSSVAVHQASE